MEIKAAWKGFRKGRAESNFLLSCGDEKFFAASVLVGRILIRRAAGNVCALAAAASSLSCARGAISPARRDASLNSCAVKKRNGGHGVDGKRRNGEFTLTFFSKTCIL